MSCHVLRTTASLSQPHTFHYFTNERVPMLSEAPSRTGLLADLR